MNLSTHISALGSLAEAAGPPRSTGQQVEYLLAGQLLSALTEGQKEGEGGEFLSMLSDHLAQQMAREGTLGIARQLSLPEEES